MTLIRQEGQVHQQLSASLEITLEQRILGELGSLKHSVEKIDRNQEKMSIRLLGGVDGDTQYGRLPMVERRSDDHEDRIKSLENDHIRWKAYAAAAALIGGCAGSVITLLVHSAITFYQRH
jgi:hypothetical protein